MSGAWRGIFQSLHNPRNDALVSTIHTRTLDDEVFRLLGFDVTRHMVVAITSCNHVRARLVAIAQIVIRAGTPVLVSFAYQQIKRLIWPLDDDVQFNG